MSFSVLLTESAARDLEEIFDYIAHHDTPRKADTILTKITYNPLPEDDPTQRKPSIELAKNQLGWEPDIQIKEGLQKTIEYFIDRLDK